MKGALLAAGLVLLLGVAGGVAWWLRPEPTAEPEPEPAEDTGLSVEKQTELMQEIGYLQQE